MKTILLAAIGMIIGHLVAPYLSSAVTAAVAASVSADGLSTKSLEIADATGRRRILLTTTTEGSPAIWFFDGAGKARLNLGLYGDDSPFIVLNDDNERAVQIFRTIGNGKTPVLVMKNNGQDRIIMGLNATPQADPFFVYFDANGAKKAVFGNY